MSQELAPTRGESSAPCFTDLGQPTVVQDLDKSIGYEPVCNFMHINFV
jgi:hypothetical protein